MEDMEVMITMGWLQENKRKTSMTNRLEKQDSRISNDYIVVL